MFLTLSVRYQKLYKYIFIVTWFLLLLLQKFQIQFYMEHFTFENVRFTLTIQNNIYIQNTNVTSLVHMNA